MRNNESRVTGRFESRSCTPIGANVDELSVDDDAVDKAGDVRVEHVVREDAVGERVLVRRRRGCRLRLRCHGRPAARTSASNFQKRAMTFPPGINSYATRALCAGGPPRGTADPTVPILGFVYTPLKRGGSLNEPIEQSVEGLGPGCAARKVVQWGIAYVAAAWGLLQGLAYLSAVFLWPAQLQRPATMALLVGLPIALVLAWYHGDRGHQRVSGREFAILTVLLLLGGGLFWWVGRMPASPPVTTTASTAVGMAQPAAAAKADGTSIAVLPFINMSGDWPASWRPNARPN